MWNRLLIALLLLASVAVGGNEVAPNKDRAHAAHTALLQLLN
jgi:hypothetical protein